MIQFTHPVPADVPLCRTGHRPQFVQTRGAPAALRAPLAMPPMWHIECIQCGIATVPCTSRAIAELRWTSDVAAHRIPLARLPQARESAYRDEAQRVA